MKILMVKVKKQRTPMACHYNYPHGWDSQKINVLIYEEHPENLGEVEEDCLCIVDNKIARRLLGEENVREVSIQEANIFGRKWKPITKVITNPDVLLSVIGKILSNHKILTTLRNHLTKEEIDSLNENKSALGISKTKEFNIEDFLI